VEKKNWLKQVLRKARSRPTAAVLYGPPGVGKTSFGAQMPKPIFLVDYQEDGINTLKIGRLVSEAVPVLPAMSDWGSTLSVLQSLATDEHDYKTLVIDTLGGFEALCHDYVCRMHYNGNWGETGFTSYQKGYETSLPYWREFVNSLDRLRDERRMSILALGHSIVKPYKNPIGDDFDRFTIALHHKTWTITERWADMVLFYDYFIDTRKAEGDRVKGQGGDTRVLRTEHCAAFVAKNRHNLPDEIMAGKSPEGAWGALSDAVVAARKGD
jgi:hypothetical protein